MLCEKGCIANYVNIVTPQVSKAMEEDKMGFGSAVCLSVQTYAPSGKKPLLSRIAAQFGLVSKILESRGESKCQKL